MKRYRLVQILAIMAIMIGHALSVSAVTDKEMEEARAIAAKYYLRYANNGSGYLDEVTPQSMSELEGKLKSKEQENLKAFKSVKVPGDYHSWDKEKLVEFWAVTFFTSPALDANAKGARVPIRKQISAMTISAPAKDAPEVAEQPKEAPVEDIAESNPSDATPTAEAAAEAEQDILSDQNAIEKDAEDAERATREEPNHTWVYVLVLAILVAVVIWLVVYAARLMKRSESTEEEESEESEKSNNGRLPVRSTEAAETQSKEIERLRRRLQDEEGRSAELGIELERMKLERSRLEDSIARLREENNRLKSAAVAPSPASPAAEIRRERPATRRPEAPARKETESQEGILKVIYLGRANNRGIFVRADRRINAGNTIYRLDTNDGLVGTFHVVDEPEVVDTALSAPLDYLANGCVGEDLEDTTGVTRIATESAGTAIFENGYWKVLRKTRIRYE